jgi:UDP:flavonoid glycosyltransferase YjiC (YdhE family)
MASCKGIIGSAGFDTIAEAAYHGIPQAVIPVRNHFEQRCNSLDVEASGIGVKLDQLVPGLQQNMKHVDPAAYRKWADRSRELFLKNLKE